MFAYDLVIKLYGFAIRMASRKNPKAALWVAGRKQAYERMLEWRSRNPGKLLWMHCASLGEYEQGRGALEAFQRAHPDWRVALSFYSPSGFEMAVPASSVEKFYLPLDLKSQVERWVEMLQPSLFVSIRYEFWLRLLDALYEKKVPTAVLSAHFRPDHWFFKPWASFALRRLKRLDSIGAQDRESLVLLSQKGFENAEFTGNGRVDRVVEIAKNPEPVEWLERWIQGRKLVVCGSIYLHELPMLLPLIDAQPERRWLLVPHEVDRVSVENISKELGSRSFALWSKGVQAVETPILILDSVGWLAKCYRYAELAYVGGGYGSGVHNLLEPAAFGCPSFFGPKHKGYPEAQALLEKGASFRAETVNAAFLEDFSSEPERRPRASRAALNYIEEQKGASRRELALIERFVRA